ncbi:hypothetical protein CSOJ01_00353 [Colletotrichum sojae]|uniref:Uncharacterized protein n=1 Tax=Colletotrichum sojae TaxID=2175907 RepID=A0A8H6JYA2_9PEZI|nr:hypothetical protein CSOJ01_00353 [Colletotrichum sojae]
MAPRRPASPRRNAVASGSSEPRRYPSTRNANRSSFGPSQTPLNKPHAQPDSTQSPCGSSSDPRPSTRLRARLQMQAQAESPESEISSLSDGDDEDDGDYGDYGDDGDFDEPVRRSRPVRRRGSQKTPSPTLSRANNSRSSRSTAAKRRSTRLELNKVDSGRVSTKTGKKKRGRPPKRARPIAEDNASDGTGDDSDGFVVDKKAKSPKTKPRRGRQALKKTSADVAKDENAFIPDWLDPRMEHAIWVQVFRYAAVVGDEQEIIDVNWLLQVARLCRSFTDPALTVLYRRPPVKDEIKAQGLVELLEKPLSTTMVNYRAKIESLHIDVRLVSLQGFASPVRMMQNLPRLSEVLLLHGYDQAPYRLLKAPIKWIYPSDLWQAFEVSPTANVEAGDKTSITRLKSWQWSSRLMDKNWETSLEKMKEAHQVPSFTSLRKIRLVNYQLPSVKLEKDPGADPEISAEDERTTKLIAESLSVLPNLEHLIFESSSIICTSLFPLLPTRLKRLELVNCSEVTADDLASFLISNGHQLEALVLHHNRALSLAFLTILGTACPHLTELRANFKYFSLLGTVDHNEPSYEHLLLPEQVPNWPSALEVVHLENLRQWDMNAAEVFLQSFIDSASVLPMLRHLSIKAMLDVPWRLRSGLRKTWQEKFENVFLRQAPDPDPHYTLRKPPTEEPVEERIVKRKPKKAPVEPTRRSSRVVSHASSTSRGLRGQNQKPKSYREPDSDEFDTDDDVDMEQSADEAGGDESGSDATDATTPPDEQFIQGLCTVVDINIDNQKPREHQYSMDDFLNNEQDFSTDPEWDSDMDFE